MVHGCVLISCLAKAQSEIRLAGHTSERRTQLQCVRCIYRDGSFGVCTLVILQVLVPVICLYCLIRAKVESVSCSEPLIVTVIFQSPRTQDCAQPFMGIQENEKRCSKALTHPPLPKFSQEICVHMYFVSNNKNINLFKYEGVLSGSFVTVSNVSLILHEFFFC